ncbi:hypothetical protein [Candidatus Epulonipiscium viviparus]|uniref:hypothetical protein n=1 Tax=Candidatus Epulonipiscium viviparus TaxID=420336 RepID=UPI0027381299|nr:hypothetical protein [Candidatus Epulopiscium viviparus]
MKNIKLLLLCMFIALSIIQTVYLWLGGPLSHIFFEAETKAVLTPITPKYIWLNTGGLYTKGLKIPNKNQEYKLMVEELQKVLFNIPDVLDQEYKQEDTSKLYNQRGIIYEYSLPLTINEIIGKSIPLEYNYKIDSIFVTLKDETLSDDSIFFINESSEYYIELKLPQKAQEFENIYYLFNNSDDEESTSLRYQPSIKDIKAPHILGNVFLANISPSMPLEYSKILFRNFLEHMDFAEIEGRADQLFEKPIMKETQLLLGGAIEFTEKNKNILTIAPSGLITYQNLRPVIEKIPQTRLEGYNIALEFIEANNLISPTIKDKLYLSNIEIDNGAYIYYFNVLYQDITVVLSENLKHILDVPAMVSVRVIDRVIKDAQWLSYSVEEIFSYEPNYIITGYSTPIDKMYSNLKGLGIERPVFSNIELVYELTGADTPLDIKWGIKYKGDWYYP